MIAAEHERSVQQVLATTSMPALLADYPVLKRTLDVRSADLEPLHLLQIVLLERHRSAAEVDPRVERAILLTVNGSPPACATRGSALSQSISTLKHGRKSGNLNQSISPDGQMSTVLDDVTNEKIDARHIRRRVEDWDTRLQALYDMIGGWLPEGWTAREGAPVRMHEEMMREFGVDPKQVNQTGEVAKLEPRAPMGHWLQRPCRSEAGQLSLSHWRSRRELRRRGLARSSCRPARRAQTRYT